MHEARRLRHILEPSVAHVVVQNRGFEALWMQMPGERVAKTLPQTIGVPLVAGVLADVRDEEIEPAVVVVVEEHGA